MALKLKDMSADELDSIKKLARSRTAAARLVERAKIILLADKGHKVPAIAAQLKLTEEHRSDLAQAVQLKWLGRTQ